jgi:hypothetical protein
MRVCLMIEGQESVSWEDWLALAKACEESSIDALFRSDHYLSVMGRPDRGSLDAWATIAALAAATSDLKLGTLVSPATFRHPSVLAKNVVTATSGSGTRGTFDFTIPFSVDGPQDGALRVFELSAEDGAVVHERVIPLHLAR